MTIDLLIVGSGGLARETMSAIAAINAVTPTFALLGFLDDNPALRGRVRAGHPVLGTPAEVDRWPDAAVLACVGTPVDVGVRTRLVRRLGLPIDRYATVVHPSVSVGLGCSIGSGSVLLAQVVLSADVRIGAHVVVMPQVVLTHDNVIEDGVTIASGVRLGGGVHLNQGCYIGAGALVRQSVTVGAGALVGMGAVVLRDVPPGEVWVGNPARRLARAVGEPPGSGQSSATRDTVGEERTTNKGSAA